MKKIFIIILIVLSLGGSAFGAYKMLIEPKQSAPERENQHISETKNISVLDIREQFAVVESENAYGSTLWIINTKPIEGYINEFLDVARNSGFIAVAPHWKEVYKLWSEIKNFGGIFSINAFEGKIFGKVVTENPYNWEHLDNEKIATALKLSGEKEKIQFQADNHGFVIRFADKNSSNYQITNNSTTTQKTRTQESGKITGNHISPDVAIRNALFTSTIDSEKEKIILKEHLEKFQINENTFLVIQQAIGPGQDVTIAMEYNQQNEHQVIIKVIIDDNNDSVDDIKKMYEENLAKNLVQSISLENKKLEASLRKMLQSVQFSEKNGVFIFQIDAPSEKELAEMMVYSMQQSLSNYLGRSRDLNRQAALRNIALMLLNYYHEHENYPKNLDVINAPKDPLDGQIGTHCTFGFKYEPTQDLQWYKISACTETEQNDGTYFITYDEDFENSDTRILQSQAKNPDEIPKMQLRDNARKHIVATISTKIQNYYAKYGKIPGKISDLSPEFLGTIPKDPLENQKNQNCSYQIIFEKITENKYSLTYCSEVSEQKIADIVTIQ